MHSFLILSFLITIFLIPITLVNLCSATSHNAKPKNISHLKFLREYDVPYNKDFQNTIIGGLSGIDYDPQKKVYYIISDDRSEKNPARFYEAEIMQCWHK